MKSFKTTESDHALNLEFFIPGASNAFSLEAARELKKLQSTHAKWKKPVIVTSIHPRLFCSGGNLSDYKKLKGKAPGLKVNREIESALNNFGNWAVPKLAVIEGDVLGGGMEWLARFDFRWSTPNALFAFWQRRIGLSTGWGGGKAWAQKIGEESIRKLLLDARILSAQEARREGLVDQVYSAWKISEEAERWAARLAGESVNKIIKWKAVREAQNFSSLWLAREHAATLKSWKT